ncbi:hypothetical protein DF185_21960 [Marinifilum breve]|uniref:FAS1 domain-containing protein n=1 Tax=Marinifilum breve TaxID=2184082 RepID=A0A2V3ZR92_9BACT|nr:hypothetical protein [Marinifilum breve]PXX95386.1 hypothetical protein DF185_21960 [Marinifilum breve]
MKYIFLLTLVGIMCFSCQKQDFIDTGKANGVTGVSILEYMKTDSYNWDTTRLVIERAGLTELFDGNDPDHEQIVFLGPTNLSILRWMLDMDYMKVSDIPVEECKSMILKHVIDGRFLKDDIPKGVKYPKEGGEDFDTLGDNKLWLYTFTLPYGGIPDAGPTFLYVGSYNLVDGTINVVVDIASHDIQCTNGVVHSLHYNYTFGDI